MIADAPQRKKHCSRAPRIVFQVPDPDRHSKPKAIPSLHLKTWEEWRACIHSNSTFKLPMAQFWRVQASFTRHREFEEREVARARLIRRRLDAAAAGQRARAAADAPAVAAT